MVNSNSIHTNNPSYEWPTDSNQYELVGKIGQGAFATVWKAIRRSSENSTNAPSEETRVCAVKILDLDHVDTNLSEIRQEVQAMRLLSHENVLTCYTAFVDNRNLLIVTPLMSKGSSLHSLSVARRVMTRNKQRNTYDTTIEQHIRHILHETLLGLQYIHENGQIHRDIKGGNVLLDGSGAVQIADFGVSGFLVQAGSQTTKAKTFVGTPCWMAPEVMEQIHGYDQSADLWSLGITALELAKGYAPYAKYPPMKVLILTIQEDPPSLATYRDYEDMMDDDDDHYDRTKFSPQFEAMVALCLQKNPAKRPTCAELLKLHFAEYQDAEYREQRRQAMVEEICNLVPDVGGTVVGSNIRTGEPPWTAGAVAQEPGMQSSANHLPGNTPISILVEQANDRPPGTTWVFADGSSSNSSQVLAGTNTQNTHAGSKTAAEEDDTIDDVLSELDEFGKLTGGEHYDKTVGRCNVSSSTAAATAPRDTNPTPTNDTATDLEDFMDEFEMNTAGEDFRRTTS